MALFEKNRSLLRFLSLSSQKFKQRTMWLRLLWGSFRIPL